MTEQFMFLTKIITHHKREALDLNYYNGASDSGTLGLADLVAAVELECYVVVYYSW